MKMDDCLTTLHYRVFGHFSLTTEMYFQYHLEHPLLPLSPGMCIYLLSSTTSSIPFFTSHSASIISVIRNRVIVIHFPCGLAIVSARLPACSPPCLVVLSLSKAV